MNTPHKNQNNRLDGGQKVSVITTIKKIIREYPGGLGIVKELIQNADDAEARTVQITLDWRNHHIDDLPEPNMEEFLQPALLIFNDAAFKEKDFIAIENINEGSKQNDLTKAGRFGQGFNSVYHLTDYPSFASLDRIKFFDPHSSVFPQGGGGWWFENSEIQEFLKVYKSGLPQGYSLENSTVFRLPLRVKSQRNANSISNTIFDRDTIQNFRDELLNISEEILLFLKSVDEIRVCEIVDREVCELLRVTTKNKQEVFAERHKLTSLLQSHASSSLSVAYLQEIETRNQERTFTSLWRVCNVIRYEEQEIQRGIALMAESGEKAVPWGGVAAKIKTSQTIINTDFFEGKAYCFLPLNFATGLPIHIHGFFDLDSARTDLTRKIDFSDPKRNIRADWNLLLVKHVLSHAYANLIKSLVEDVGEQDPQRFYRFFPVSSSNPTLKDLPKFVIEQLQSHRVMRSAIAHPAMNEGQRQVVDSHWVKPTAIKVLPEGWDNLLEPLRLEKIDLPDPPLPSEIEKVFKDSGKPLATFQPSDLRSQLQTKQPLGMPLEKAPRACLRKKEWVIGLLKYCLSDRQRDVNGLPLAILADGTLQSFDYSTTGFIYITPPDAYEILQEQIFADFPEWFLDDELLTQVRDIEKSNGITLLMPVEVAKRLKALLTPDGSTPVGWQPDSQAIPNASWLALVYQYLADLKNFPTEFKQIPLVPCRDGLLYAGANDATPLWYGTKFSREILEMLEYFGVRLFAAQGELQNAIATFRGRYPHPMIDMLSVPKVIDKLAGLLRLPVYSREVYEKLVDYLCSDRTWLYGDGRNDEGRKTKLRQLPIYPTISGELTDINDRVFVPTGYKLPKIAGKLKLLRLGASETNQDWKILYDYLKVKPLNHATMLRYLLRDYGNLSNVEQIEALEWIKNYLHLAEGEAKRGDPSSDLKKEVREARLIRCIDGQLRAANTIYHPKAHETVRQILGERTYSPDMEVYKNQDEWFDFFHELRMQTILNARDLLAYVDAQIQKAKSGLTQEITDSLLNIFSHLARNWEVLSKKEAFIQLAEELNKRAWLPPELSPEKLKRFVGYEIPQNKLYRSNEIYLTNLGYGYLLASQKPLLTIKGSIPKGFLASAFGFYYPDAALVVNHFKKLIDLWNVGNGNGINNDDFEQSIKSIYRYFYTQFCIGKDRDVKRQQWLRDQLNDYKCLWDYGSFWLPKHMFQCKLPYFGKRRRSFLVSPPEFCQVYELLGQKKFPEIGDYVDFMAELAYDCKGNALSEVDAKCAYEVLQLLTQELEKEKLSASDYDLLLLTEDNLLLPPAQILIPDAPWRIEAVRDRNAIKILHPQVPHSLAITLGSRSLAKDVDEVTKEINPSDDQEANKICGKWQSLMRSPEFIMGLRRLILDQHGNVQVDLDWLSKVSVQAAAKISTNLMLDQVCIASGVEGSYYFDPHKFAFYLSQDSDDLMQHHLTESLNHHLQNLKLSDTSRLLTILNKRTSEIEKLLDRLKVKPLPLSPTLELPDVQETAEFDDIFGDDPLEDLENIEPQETVTESINETTDIPKSDPPPSDTPAKSTVPKPIPSNKNNPAPNPIPVIPIIKPAKPPVSTIRPRSILDVKSPSQGNVENTAQTSEVSLVAKSSTTERMPSTSQSRTTRSRSGGRVKLRSLAKRITPSQQYRNGVRVRSGLEVDPQKSVEELPESEAQKIDAAGMDKVMKYEGDHEREPKDMNEDSPNHPGYDVKSINSKTGEVRYIEVKSLRNTWDKRGVCMSLKQFKKGHEKQDDFWLYVVERAETDEARVITIQNPVGLVGEFYYDDSWRQLADNETSEVK
jgi:sacsin